jgi:hypothetical protein
MPQQAPEQDLPETEAVLTDQEAWNYVHTTNADTPEGERAYRNQRMERYFQEQDRQKREYDEQYWEKARLDPQFQKDILGRPVINMARTEAADPVLFNDEVLNNAQIEGIIGRNLIDENDADAQRNRLAGEFFGVPRMSNAEFAQAMTTRAQQTRDFRVAAEGGNLDIWEAILTGHDTVPGEMFQKWRDTNPGLVNQGNERQLYLAWQRTEAQAKLDAMRLAPAGQAIMAAIQADQTNAPDMQEKYDAAGDAVANMDPRDVNKVFTLVRDVINRQGQAEGAAPVAPIIDNFWKAAITKGGLGTLSNLDLGAQQVELRNLRDQILNSKNPQYDTETGRVIGGKVEGRKTVDASSEQTSKAIADIDRAERIIKVVRQGKDIIRQSDPYHYLTPEGSFWRSIEAGTYMTAEYALPMAVATAASLTTGPAAPLAGAVAFGVNAAAMGADDFNKMMLDSPDMDPRAAAQVATLTGAANAALELLQIEHMMGHAAPLLRQNIRDGAVKAFMRNVTSSGIEQNLIEAGQDFISTVVPAIASNLRPDMNKQDIYQELGQYLSQRWDVAMALLVPTLVGAGFLSHHQLKDPERAVMNDATLRQMGFNDLHRNQIFAEHTAEARFAKMLELYPERTEEAIKAGWAETEKELAKGTSPYVTEAAPKFTIEERPNPDGTTVYHVVDPVGTSVFNTHDKDVALDQLRQHTEQMVAQRLAAEQQAATGAEAESRAAEGEAGVRILEPKEGRGTAAVALDFTTDERPSEPRRQAVEGLQRDLSAEGRDDQVRIVSAVNPATPTGRRMLDLIQAFERLTGKQVVFVASANNKHLSFTGAVRKSDPNTIFLDAAGNRNVLALLGHEWSHTLEDSNPTLYNEMVAKLRPLIIDWAVQEGILKKDYKEGDVTKELVANILGDAWAHPEFLKRLAQRNPTLFEKIVKAIQDFIENLKNLAHRSEWGTEAIINDLDAVHELLLDTLDEARKGAAAEAGPEMADSEVAFAVRREVEKGFYRRIDEVVADKFPKSTSPEQAKATLKSANLKAEEIKWTGVIPAIDRIAQENNGKVPKEKLEQHLQNEGDAKFKEVTLGDEADLKRLQAEQSKYDEAIQGLNRQIGEATNYEITVRDLVSGFKRPEDLTPEARKLWDARIAAIAEREKLYTDWVEARVPAPKFGSYTLSGGENYREVVLSMPVFGTHYTIEERGENTVVVAPNGAIVWQDKTENITPENRQFLRDQFQQPEPKTEYTSNHFPDVPNYVAHMRLDDRSDAEGKSGLFIEEIQSDRHQAAREKGYREEGKTTPEAAKQIFQISDADWAAMDQETRQSYADEVDQGGTHLKGLIPDAPFRKDWPLAMFKRALRDAVATGKEWIGWTTGETQAERYDLSKQVEAIKWDNIDGAGNQIQIQVQRKGTSHFLDTGTHSAAKLPDVVGKEIADKIIEQARDGREFDTISGLDLKVGGEGMKGFYDKILPNEIGKYVKQWGGKVEEGALENARAKQDYYFERQLENGEWHRAGAIGGADTLEEAQAKVDDLNARGRNTWRVAKSDTASLPIWKVEITPQMKESVAAGQTQFATRAGKLGQATAEGPNRLESIQAALEQLYAAPETRLDLLRRIRRELTRIIGEHRAAEAGLSQTPAVDPQVKIDQLDAEETKAHEDLNLQEQAALDQNTLNIGDRYGERIQNEQDLQKRRQLEREMKLVEGEQRRGIEKQFTERRKALRDLYAMQRQTAKTEAAAANKAATAEGRAELEKMRRVHAFGELNAILRALPPEVRGQIGGFQTLASLPTTETALTDFLVSRIDKVSEVLEKTIKREYTARVYKLLKTYQLKKVGGVYKSRIGDAQDVVNRLKTITKMSNDQVATAMSSIEAELSAPGIEPERESALTMERHLLQTYGDFKNRSAEEMFTAYDDLRQTISEGRAAWAAKEEVRLGKQRRNAAEILAGQPAGSAAGVAAAENQSFWQNSVSFIRSLFSFGQLLEEVMPKGTTFVKEWQDKSRRADGASEDFVRAASERFAAAMRGALGSNSVIKIGKTIQDMQAMNIDGKDGKASKMQAIYYLMAWQQTEARARLESQGWTQDHMTAFENALNDPASRAVFRYLRSEYEATYKLIDEVYHRQNGTHLPKVEFYAPLRYFHAGTEIEIDPTGQPIATSGTTPSFAMARVAHNAQIRQMDAMEVYFQHMVQAAHYIHNSDLIREMRGTLNNAEVKMSMQQKLGPYGYNNLNNWVNALARKGSNAANEDRLMREMLKSLTTAKVVSSLAFNPKTIAMQFDSLFRFAMAVPANKLLKTVVSGDWVKNIPAAYHSETVQRRLISGMSPEAKFVLQQANMSPTVLLELSRIGMAPIQYTDAWLTTVSSAIVYTEAYNRAIENDAAIPQAEAAALDEMDAAVHNFSQPTGITSKSLHEVTGGPGWKLLMMFMADPRLKSAIVAKAGFEIYRGENVGLNLQRIVVIEFMSIVSQMLANLYHNWTTDDDQDIWTTGFWHAVLLAPFQGWFLVGSLADSTIAALLGEKLPPYKSSDPLTEVYRRGQHAVKHAGDILHPENTADFVKVLDDVLKTAGLLYPPAASLNAVTNLAKPTIGAIQTMTK